MPGKARSRKARRMNQKKETRSSQPDRVSRPDEVNASPKPVSQIDTPTPSPSAPSKVKPIVARYPYIGSELRMISILAAIMLIALFILAFILS